MILVAGATGTTGAEVLRQLREAGEPVRALTRSESSAADLRAKGVEAAVGDLADSASLGAALEGVRAAYLVQPASADLPEHEGGFAQACAQASVEHIVQLSVVGASPDAPLDLARMHHAAQEAVRAAGVPTTFVQPNGFMQNTLAWGAQIPGGVIHVPVPDARWSIVDVRDVAAVAVAAFRDPGTHAGQAYTVTGPKASSPREQVSIVADLLDRPLEVHELSIDETKAQLASFGVPPWTAERLGELFAFYATGEAEGVAPDVEQLLDRPPTDFATFARDHRDAFAGGGAA